MLSNKYQMWMTFNGCAEKLRFPVLPERINIRKGLANTSVAIQGLGEVVIMQDPSALLVSFSSSFPAQPFPGVQFENLKPPVDIVEQIDKWKTSNRPVQFMVTNTVVNTHFAIDSFNYFERGGDIGTIYYTIVLKEYKEVAARQVTIENEAAVIPEPAPERVDNRLPELTHTVVPGDSLYAIARRILGRGSKWPKIFELNREIIRNPSLIFPGQVLRLPAA